jgi:NADP-dependent 3-hydroxy acid dehydrogenase YdfG
VLVTGATSGFGLAIARRFAKEGARIVATGRREDRLAKLKAELGKNCETLAFDVTDRKAVEKALGGLAVDVVVANAGLALGLEPAPKADLADWERMTATNIDGLLYTVRTVLPGMVERDRGHVVLLSSVAASYPYPGGNVYGATKAFVTQFALNLRADLLGANVRVTSIEPGLAETEFSLVRFKGDAAKAAQPYQGIDPLTAEDVAEAVWWACSQPARVNVNRIEMMASMQAFGPFAFKRKA